MDVLTSFYGDKYNKLVEKETLVKEQTMLKLAEKTKISFSLAADPVVNDSVFDQNAVKQQIYYENENRNKNGCLHFAGKQIAPGLSLACLH